MVHIEKHLRLGLVFAVMGIVGSLTLSGSPAAAQQQGTNTIAVEDRVVALDVENARLGDVLPDMMKSVDADYALDKDIKEFRVTIHITSAKLKDALATMMKISTGPVVVKVEGGLYHFMLGTVAGSSTTHAAEKSPRRPGGPPYNGGNPLAAATSELFTYLAGCEPAFSGKSAHPSSGALVARGGASLSGSRNFSSYGFINGNFVGSSSSTPDISRPQATTITGGGGGYFGPIKIGN